MLWQQIELASQFGPSYPWLLIAEVALALIMSAIKPAARARLRIAVLLLIVSFVGTAASVLITLIGTSAAPVALVRVISFLSQAMFAIGTIQIFAVLLFRIVLPPLRLEPSPILRDTLLGLAYIAATLSLLGRNGVDLTGIVATSAVLTGVIGFSLQDTLGNVAGGVSLQLEKTIMVGDYIRVGTQEGVVKETRWRQTSIETYDFDTVVIPNSVLTRSVVTVLGRVAAGMKPHRVVLPFNVSLEHHPGDVIAAVEQAFKGHAIDNVSTTQLPRCMLREFVDNRGGYGLIYWIVDPIRIFPTNSEINRRVVNALKRNGMNFAIPAQALTITTNRVVRDGAIGRAELDRRVEALIPVDMFKSLTDEERRELAGHLSVASFSRGDVMNYQGEEADYLYILTRGKAEVNVSIPGGATKHVATLGAGDVFGEMGMMTGQARTATVSAASEVICYRLNKADFKTILERRSEITESISLLLAKRKLELEGVQAGMEGDPTSVMTQTQGDLVRRIRSFFLLSA